MAKSKKTSVDRRGFLKGAAAGAAALVAKPELASAQQAAPQGGQTSPNRGANGSAAEPTQVALARETGARPVESSRVIEHPGSDYMVDVLKTLNIEYLAANPGSTFESLHESLINYGDNKMPEFLTCCHEESAVAMAHGYAKIEGKPMMALIHGDIGLQHASMAIYNAYVDRVPIYMVVGNHADGARRNPGVQSLAQRAGFGRAGPRLHEVGRRAAIARPFRRIGGACLQHRDDAAQRSGADRLQCRDTRRSRFRARRRASRNSRLTTPPAGDLAAVRGSRETCWSTRSGRRSSRSAWRERPRA